MRWVKWLTGVTLTAVLVAVALYLSRYWTHSLWSRDGLLGFEVLRPAGDLMRRWLRGTEAAEFDILVWGVGAFLVLTVLQWIWSKVFGS